jgi:hypothetical protein
MGSDSKFLTTAKTVSFLIRTEENSAFWTVFHTLIIKAAIMCSNSHSFTQISTGSHFRGSAKLAVMIDKRQPALHREGGAVGSVGICRIFTILSPSRSLVISLDKRYMDIDMEQVKASPLFDIEYGVNIWKNFRLA